MMKNIITELGSGRILVLVHSNADLDAVGCAAALKESFPDVTIGTPDTVSRAGKALMARLGMEVVSQPDPADYDRVVVVDASSPSMMGEMGERLVDPILIDHHRTTGWTPSLYLNDPSKGACTEVVYGLLREAGVEITPAAAMGLLAGIVADTGQFRHADGESIRTFLEILDGSGLTPKEVFAAIEMEDDYSRRVACLKGCQRLRFVNAGKFIVAQTIVSTFEAAVCQRLLGVGADAALAGSQRDEEVRVSGRLRQRLTEMGVNLGSILEEVGAQTGCSGGGHEGAAGLTGNGDVEAVLNICTARLVEEITAMQKSAMD